MKVASERGIISLILIAAAIMIPTVSATGQPWELCGAIGQLPCNGYDSARGSLTTFCHNSCIGSSGICEACPKGAPTFGVCGDLGQRPCTIDNPATGGMATYCYNNKCIGSKGVCEECGTGRWAESNKPWENCGSLGQKPCNGYDSARGSQITFCHNLCISGTTGMCVECPGGQPALGVCGDLGQSPCTIDNPATGGMATYCYNNKCIGSKGVCEECETGRWAESDKPWENCGSLGQKPCNGYDSARGSQITFCHNLCISGTTGMCVECPGGQPALGVCGDLGQRPCTIDNPATGGMATYCYNNKCIGSKGVCEECGTGTWAYESNGQTSGPFQRIIQTINPWKPGSPAGTICTSPLIRLINRITSDPDAKKDGIIDADHCYQAIAVNLGDTSLCPSIQRAAPRSKCYLLIAERQGSTAACYLMPEQLETMDSYHQIECIQSVAMKTGNSHVCEEMGERNISRMLIGEISRKTCLQRVAAGGLSP